MKFKFPSLIMLVVFAVMVSSCGEDDEPTLASTNFDYAMHNGQTVPTAPYTGLHPTDFSANLALTETEDGKTMVTVTLNNTVAGVTYNVHAHDVADAATTPNGTPYNESPNTDVFAQAVEGTGGTVTVSQESTSTYAALNADYEGFFVVHDPLQAVNTADITTYLVVGSFAREQADSDVESTTFDYDFNTGQLVADFAYVGSHADNLTASINVTELTDGRSRITVQLQNTMDLVTYNTHAHDMADAATTPNGTPYNETPNAEVFATAITGNGGTAGHSFISEMSYSEITSDYDGFFVVHDPLQALDTTNPATYVILGVFAR